MSLVSFDSSPVGPKELARRIAERMSGLAVSVSGVVINLQSGDIVVAEISGAQVQISGQAVVAKTSGEVIKVSGEVVKISGEVVQNQVPTDGRSRPLLVINNVSGGTILASGDINAMTLVNLSGNDNVFVGFASADEMPRSGVGILVPGGAAVNLGIDNFNKVRVFAQTSGEVVSYFGTAF